MNPPANAVADRRACTRSRGEACRWITQVRLRPGRDARLIDLSEGGAQIEASFRLLPGTRVELQLGAEGWRCVAHARVLRCRVSALVPEDGVRYRAGLIFEPPLLLPPRAGGYQVPMEHESSRSEMGTDYPAPQAGLRRVR